MKVRDGSTFIVRVPCRIASYEDTQPKHAEIAVALLSEIGILVDRAEDRKKALEVGMNDRVAKPIDMNKLIPVLLQYIS